MGTAVLTDHDALAVTCRALRLHGHDPSGRFARLGYNSRLPTLAAAALEVKLALERAWRARRRAIAAARPVGGFRLRTVVRAAAEFSMSNPAGHRRLDHPPQHRDAT